MTGIEAVFSSHTPVRGHQTMLALDCPISVKEPRRYVFQQRMGLAIADINEDYALDFLDVIRFQRMTPDLYALGVRQNVNELPAVRSEEHTSEIQSLMRISYAVFLFQKKN